MKFLLAKGATIKLQLRQWFSPCQKLDLTHIHTNWNCHMYTRITSFMCTRKSTCTHTSTHAHACTHTNTHKHVSTYTRTHTYTAVQAARTPSFPGRHSGPQLILLSKFSAALCIAFSAKPLISCLHAFHRKIMAVSMFFTVATMLCTAFSAKPLTSFFC